MRGNDYGWRRVIYCLHYRNKPLTNSHEGTWFLIKLTHRSETALREEKSSRRINGAKGLTAYYARPTLPVTDPYRAEKQLRDRLIAHREIPNFRGLSRSIWHIFPWPQTSLGWYMELY